MFHKWMIGAGIAVASLIVWYVYAFEDSGPTSFIIAKEIPITVSDVTATLEKAELIAQTSLSPEIINTTGSDSPITPRTLSLFIQLQMVFKHSQNLGTHFDEVAAWLKARYPEEIALRILAVYKRYLECEIDLSSEYKSWSYPKEPDDIIDFLRDIQDFRREHLGSETADLLFGVDIKSREYRVRKGAVINNSELYGVEKENLVALLNEDMWGDESVSPDLITNSYNRYQEKLNLYSRDLDEMESAEEKEEMIRSFRKDYFPPDVVQRLETVDKKIMAESENEEAYFREEEKIMGSDELTDTEKNSALTDLQDQLFGENADAFRRREAKRIALNKISG